MDSYNIYIVSTDDFKAKKLVGEKMSYMSASVRQESVSAKLSPLTYFTLVVEEGSERDLELKANLEE